MYLRTFNTCETVGRPQACCYVNTNGPWGICWSSLGGHPQPTSLPLLRSILGGFSRAVQPNGNNMSRTTVRCPACSRSHFRRKCKSYLWSYGICSYNQYITYNLNCKSCALLRLHWSWWLQYIDDKDWRTKWISLAELKMGWQLCLKYVFDSVSVFYLSFICLFLCLFLCLCLILWNKSFWQSWKRAGSCVWNV